VHFSLARNSVRFVQVYTKVCNYVFDIQLTEINVQIVYYDPNQRFTSSHLSLFNDLVEHADETLCLTWWTQAKTLIDYVAFYFGGKVYNMFHTTNATIKVMGIVTREISMG
jgi:hypothetical protein